ncbi:MAG: hypothetical protein JXB33_07135 [Clostridia bacterium]|nr:hypothetical protein [Clostridia bacterium]
MAAFILFAGLFIYLASDGMSIRPLLLMNSLSDGHVAAIGFAMTVYSFLLYILSIGIAREIKVKYKSPLFIFQLIFFMLTGICGYTLNTVFVSEVAAYLFLSGLIYFTLAGIYFLIQKRIYSRYFSRMMMAATSLPAIPFAFFSYIYLFTDRPAFSSSAALLEIIFSVILLVLILLYNVTNMVYLFYIGRRVY